MPVAGLSAGQQLLLEAVAASPLRDEVYLTGGTALSAAYLHHRESLDIDIFSRRRPDLLRVIRVLQGVAESVSEPSRVHDRVEFTVRVAGESLRVEFVHYDFDRIAPSTRWLCGLEVDSLRDMLANKLSAAIDRSAAKDFADILLLLRQPGLTLDQGLTDCQSKFGWPAIRILAQQAFVRGARLDHWPELHPPLPLEQARVELRALAASLCQLPEE